MRRAADRGRSASARAAVGDHGHRARGRGARGLNSVSRTDPWTSTRGREPAPRAGARGAAADPGATERRRSTPGGRRGRAQNPNGWRRRLAGHRRQRRDAHRRRPGRRRRRPTPARRRGLARSTPRARPAIADRHPDHRRRWPALPLPLHGADRVGAAGGFPGIDIKGDGGRSSSPRRCIPTPVARTSRSTAGARATSSRSSCRRDHRAVRHRRRRRSRRSSTSGTRRRSTCCSSTSAATIPRPRRWVEVTGRARTTAPRRRSAGSAPAS